MKLNLGLLILRLFAGLTMLISHGWPKLSNFSAMSTKFPDVIGLGSQVSLSLAVFSEVFCSIALVIGLLTRWVSIPLLITMAVAFFIVHGSDPFNSKELAFMYMGVYATLICTGSGDFSIDRFIKK
ncbi:DoxX family protein [Halobacteriovorax sp. JY17]|uniref:DoxX family protein n=1 Tax=Halobacteriovorax sp. JY17 TaxID=2014617 RepID=UPI000C5C4530|nr:DoxX family protein [Halobacteriovorax sp. JY17]PIK15707.1 MAG: transmembrane DoxX protein [Halobacteriovorax sp. JY17]